MLIGEALMRAHDPSREIEAYLALRRFLTELQTARSFTIVARAVGHHRVDAVVARGFGAIRFTGADDFAIAALENEIGLADCPTACARSGATLGPFWRTESMPPCGRACVRINLAAGQQRLVVAGVQGEMKLPDQHLFRFRNNLSWIC